MKARAEIDISPLNCGGRNTYVTDLPSFSRGDPQQIEEQQGYDLGVTTWQYRLMDELETREGYCATYHTLTFAKEKPEVEVRKDIKNWIYRLKRWHKEIQLKAALEVENEHLVHPQ